jgi:hypothetical protein
MGMMKELVRGPIKCAETLAADMCLKARAMELQYHEHFHPVQHDVSGRGRGDGLGGNSLARVLGAQCVHTNPDVLRTMLRVLLDEIAGTHEGGWEPEDYLHEDLLIQEFAGARVTSSTRFTVDWKSSEKATADYFVYYTKIKAEYVGHPFTRDIINEPKPPSMEQLESMEKPPPNYVQQCSDFYNHNYVGQVRLCCVNKCSK